MAVRKGIRQVNPIKRHSYDDHDIGNYVSYEALPAPFQIFVASLQAASVPKDWKVDKLDTRWCNVMVEELEALKKNKTLGLSYLPEGKKAVKGCVHEFKFFAL